MGAIAVYIKYAEVDITELDPSTPFEIVTQFSMTYLFDNGDFSYGDSQSYYFVIVLLSALVTLGLRAFRYVRANKCSQCNGPIVLDFLSMFFRSAGRQFSYPAFSFSAFQSRRWPCPVCPCLPVRAV